MGIIYIVGNWLFLFKVHFHSFVSGFKPQIFVKFNCLSSTNSRNFNAPVIHFTARIKIFLLSLRFPIPVLQERQTYPLILPVSWSWSNETDLLLITGFILSQTGQ